MLKAKQVFQKEETFKIAKKQGVKWFEIFFFTNFFQPF
jgi:hypothetical protein